MTHRRPQRIAIVACTGLLGCLFLLAGIQKLASPAEFEQAILRLPVGDGITGLSLVLIPSIELALGVGYLIGLGGLLRNLLSFLILLVFTGVLVYFGTRFPGSECGCLRFTDSGFGTGPWFGVVRNIVLEAIPEPLRVVERLHPPLDVVGLHHRFSEESAASTSSPAAGSLAPRWIMSPRRGSGIASTVHDHLALKSDMPARDS